MLNFTNMSAVGLIPTFLDTFDPRPAREQLDRNYRHGGGWFALDSFDIRDAFIPGRAKLIYPGDSPMREISRAQLRDETIIVFQYAFVAIVQADGSFEVSRMD